MDIEHIVFILSSYPSPEFPLFGVFSQRIVQAMAGLGVRCTVISPVSAFHAVHHGAYPPKRYMDSGPAGEPIAVYRPRFMSWSAKRIGPVTTMSLTYRAFRRAVMETVDALPVAPDAIYGHFIYSSGAVAVDRGAALGVPSFVGVGEGTFWSVRHFGFERATADLAGVTGVVAVSTVLAEAMIERASIPAERIGVFPNAVDLEVFVPRDKATARRHVGLDDDDFVVAFLGTFDDNKGPDRVVAAVDGLEGVRVLLMGRGELTVEHPSVAFRGSVLPEEVPTYLSAADIFVLPTQWEGSCHAIIEAMACGLPVVTSDGRFNDDIVDDEVALRVGSLDVSAIREAIVRLKDDAELRASMGARALAHSRSFAIGDRVRRIYDWMVTRRRQGGFGGWGIS